MIFSRPSMIGLQSFAKKFDKTVAKEVNLPSSTTSLYRSTSTASLSTDFQTKVEYTGVMFFKGTLMRFQIKFLDEVGSYKESFSRARS